MPNRLSDIQNISGEEQPLHIVNAVAAAETVKTLEDIKLETKGVRENTNALKNSIDNLLKIFNENFKLSETLEVLKDNIEEKNISKIVSTKFIKEEDITSAPLSNEFKTIIKNLTSNLKIFADNLEKNQGTISNASGKPVTITIESDQVDKSERKADKQREIIEKDLADDPERLKKIDTKALGIDFSKIISQSFASAAAASANPLTALLTTPQLISSVLGGLFSKGGIILTGIGTLLWTFRDELMGIINEFIKEMPKMYESLKNAFFDEEGNFSFAKAYNIGIEKAKEGLGKLWEDFKELNPITRGLIGALTALATIGPLIISVGLIKAIKSATTSILSLFTALTGTGEAAKGAADAAAASENASKNASKKMAKIGLITALSRLMPVLLNPYAWLTVFIGSQLVPVIGDALDWLKEEQEKALEKAKKEANEALDKFKKRIDDPKTTQSERDHAAEIAVEKSAAAVYEKMSTNRSNRISLLRNPENPENQKLMEFLLLHIQRKKEEASKSGKEYEPTNFDKTIERIDKLNKLYSTFKQAKQGEDLKVKLLPVIRNLGGIDTTRKDLSNHLVKSGRKENEIVKIQTMFEKMVGKISDSYNFEDLKHMGPPKKETLPPANQFKGKDRSLFNWIREWWNSATSSTSDDSKLKIIKEIASGNDKNVITIVKGPTNVYYDGQQTVVEQGRTQTFTGSMIPIPDALT